MAILGLLKEQELHGYEIRRRLGEILGPLGRLSFGSLYPALNRLEGAGAVRVIEVSKSRTGLTTERGRKVYELTAEGEARFGQLLDDEAPGEDDKAFAFRMAFARYLPREARLRFLLRRRDQLAQRLKDSRRALSNGTTLLDDYSRSFIEHGNETTASDISWLDRMITREQKASPETPRNTQMLKESK